MAAPNERYYFGDLRLLKHGYDHAEIPARAVLQRFQGTDQLRELILPASANLSLGVQVRCVVPRNASTGDRKGFRADVAACRRLLEARSLRADPLVWIEDDARSKAVGSYIAGVLTSVAHGYATGDRLLIRRIGAGLFTLAVATVTGADTLTLVPVTGGPAIHAIAALDEIHLVEAYWLGMVAQPCEKVEPTDDDFWSDAAVYQFLGSGTYDYNRTSAYAGS